MFVEDLLLLELQTVDLGLHLGYNLAALVADLEVLFEFLKAGVEILVYGLGCFGGVG